MCTCLMQISHFWYRCIAFFSCNSTENQTDSVLCVIQSWYIHIWASLAVYCKHSRTVDFTCVWTSVGACVCCVWVCKQAYGACTELAYVHEYDCQGNHFGVRYFANPTIINGRRTYTIYVAYTKYTMVSSTPHFLGHPAHAQAVCTRPSPFFVGRG